MYLSNELNIYNNNLADTRLEFNIYSKENQEYLTEHFELFYTQENSFLYSHYRQTETMTHNNNNSNVIHKQNTIKPIYLVASIPKNKDLWTTINNKRLRLNNKLILKSI